MEAGAPSAGLQHRGVITGRRSERNLTDETPWDTTQDLKMHFEVEVSVSFVTVQVSGRQEALPLPKSRMSSVRLQVGGSHPCCGPQGMKESGGGRPSSHGFASGWGHPSAYRGWGPHCQEG